MGGRDDSSLCLLRRYQKSREKLKFNSKEQTASCLPLMTTAPVYSQVESSEEKYSSLFFRSLFFHLLLQWTPDKCHTLMLSHTHNQKL